MHSKGVHLRAPTCMPSTVNYTLSLNKGQTIKHTFFRALIKASSGLETDGRLTLLCRGLKNALRPLVSNNVSGLIDFMPNAAKNRHICYYKWLYSATIWKRPTNNF